MAEGMLFLVYFEAEFVEDALGDGGEVAGDGLEELLYLLLDGFDLFVTLQ